MDFKEKWRIVEQGTAPKTAATCFYNRVEWDYDAEDIMPLVDDSPKVMEHLECQEMKDERLHAVKYRDLIVEKRDKDGK